MAEQEWSQDFLAYSAAFIGEEDLEMGDKIRLPQEALEDLDRMDVEFPIHFLIANGYTGLAVAGTAKDFTSAPGTAIFPRWMMTYLSLEEGDTAKISLARLPKVSAATFKPMSRSFDMLKDAKAALEKMLADFSTLTRGVIVYGNEQAGRGYVTDDRLAAQVVALEPADFVVITDSDIEVNFVPSDFSRAREIEKRQEEIEAGEFVPFAGRGQIASPSGVRDMVPCPICGARVPSASFPLHQAACERRMRRGPAPTAAKAQRVAARAPSPQRVAARAPSPQRVAARPPSPQRVAARAPSPQRVAARPPSPQRAAARTPSPQRVATRAPTKADSPRGRVPAGKPQTVAAQTAPSRVWRCPHCSQPFTSRGVYLSHITSCR